MRRRIETTIGRWVEHFDCHRFSIEVMWYLTGILQTVRRDPTGPRPDQGSEFRVLKGSQAVDSFAQVFAGEPGRSMYGCQARASSPPDVHHGRNWALSTSDRSMLLASRPATALAARPP